MSRSGAFLTALFGCLLFSPTLAQAKISTYWYAPQLMAKVDDASNRLQFMGPHIAPGNELGFVVDENTTFVLERMAGNNLGVNLFFTESGVEQKSNGLLSLTTTSVPYKKERVVSIVFADIEAYEILMNTFRSTATPWCVIPVGVNKAEDNVLCVATQKDAEQLIDALVTLAAANGTSLHVPYGMTLEAMSEKETQKHPELSGFQVKSTDTDGPAAQAGISDQDILHLVNGKPCTRENLIAAVTDATAKPTGGAIHLEIVRRSKFMTLDVNFPHWTMGDVAALRQQITNSAQPGSVPPGTAPSGAAVSVPGGFHLGINVRPVVDSDVAALGLPKAMGLLVTKVEKGSIAEDMGVQVGDVIVQANGADVGDVDAFGQLVRSGAVKSFRVWRKGQNLDLAVPQSM
jgi:hypothetical protein